MNKEIFIVTAYRYGDKESHSYVVGVFSDVICSTLAAYDEEDNRGKKYSCEIIRMDLNDFSKKKEIIKGI